MAAISYLSVNASTCGCDLSGFLQESEAEKYQWVQIILAVSSCLCLVVSAIFTVINSCGGCGPGSCCLDCCHKHFCPCKACNCREWPSCKRYLEEQAARATHACPASASFQSDTTHAARRQATPEASTPDGEAHQSTTSGSQHTLSLTVHTDAVNRETEITMDSSHAAEESSALLRDIRNLSTDLQTLPSSATREDIALRPSADDTDDDIDEHPDTTV